MLNMVNGSVQSELSRFFQVVQNNPLAFSSVTPAAFCKARKKFSHTAFKDLNACLAKTFYESDSVRRWNGLRLLAVDAPVTTLPQSNELYEYFGKSISTSSHPSARVSQLYDISNKLSVDVQVAPYSVGERELAAKHLDYAGEGDLVLYDRGYPATWLFVMHKLRNIHFCARAPVDSSNIVRDFIKSGRREAIVNFPCVEKSLKKCRKLGLPTDPIKLRIIRVNLGNGNFEILLTSLRDRNQFPHKCFKNLYHQRWLVEEDYKLMKSRLEMENFSGLSAEAVKQDIHAKVLTKNIAAIAILEADGIADEAYKNRNRKYKINFTYALSQFKDNIVRFIMGMWPPGSAEMLIMRISGAVNAVRPERSFTRRDGDKMRKRIKRHYMAYKRVG